MCIRDSTLVVATATAITRRILRVVLERHASTLTEFGHLLETFVVGEVIKQATWLDKATMWHHWRTRDGDEVDLVLERDDGSIVGIEVKAGTRVNASDLLGLRKLQSLDRERFIAGVAFYTGERSYAAAPGILVLPIDRLWVSQRAV